MRVRWDAGQLHIAAHPSANRAVHAFVPRWHFDMVLDEQVPPNEAKPVMRLDTAFAAQHGRPASQALCPPPLHAQAPNHDVLAESW